MRLTLRLIRIYIYICISNLVRKSDRGKLHFLYVGDFCISVFTRLTLFFPLFSATAEVVNFSLRAEYAFH